MQETQVLSLCREDPLEKGMATRSSILAWRIPWTEEPGGLQPTGLQRVQHDRATNTLELLLLCWLHTHHFICFISFNPSYNPVGLPWWLSGKESTCNAEGSGDLVRSLGWEDRLEEVMATPLQYSCLENPMDRGAWQAAVHRVTKESDTT